MTKICSQCGAVLPEAARACQFCDSSFSVGFSAMEESADISTRGIPARNPLTEGPGIEIAGSAPGTTPETMQEAAWRGELAQRLRAYRTRRGKLSANQNQASFAFNESSGSSQLGPSSGASSVDIEEVPAHRSDDFSFTIAIGRSAKEKAVDESPVEIDVSSRLDADVSASEQPMQADAYGSAGLYPVAPIDDRRLAGIIDLFCLLFAYGGFLGLFGSLGGHFTLSKLSAAVCLTTFAVVYMQYFALFTIFGGTTPGMMMRGLQVVSFSGEPPAPGQMLLRSAGYLLSAGTFFLGFLWALWDSDELTWHDRLSRTYLSVEQTLPDLETSDAAHSR